MIIDVVEEVVQTYEPEGNMMAIMSATTTFAGMAIATAFSAALLY